MTRNLSNHSLARRASARIAILAAGVFALFAVPASAATAIDPHGTWLRPEGGVRFSFYDCNGLLCAKVIGAQNPEDQSSIGTVILRGASKTGANEWRGKLYNSEDGKTYDGIITVTSANQLELKGCLWGVLCSGETWKRIGPAPTPTAAAAPKPPQAAATAAAPKVVAATAPTAPAKPQAAPAPAPKKAQASAPTAEAAAAPDAAPHPQATGLRARAADMRRRAQQAMADFVK